MKKKRFVLIPYEVKSRDYKPRLLLSFFLAKNGFKVIFGRKAEVEYFSRCFSNSIYIGLQSTNIYLNFYKKVKSNNNKLILFDEEGIVTLSKKTYLKTKFSNELANLCDIFFCWGEKSYKFILKYRSKFKKKLVVAGNLRFDILKKKFEFLNKDNSNIIKKKYKKYILISCSFGNVNHFDKRFEKISFYKKNKIFNDNESKKNYKYYLNYNKDKFKENINLVKFLSQNFKNINFIVRPHPSEKIDSYNVIKNKFSNVYVTNEFSIAEWLKWSKLHIHYYCTTSLEAGAMGVENLAFKQGYNSKYFIDIPYIFSHKIDNLTEVKKLVNKVLKNKINTKKNKEIEKYIYNFYSKNAHTKIVNQIKNLSKNFKLNGYENYSKIDLIKKKLINFKFLFKNFGKYTDYKSPNLFVHELKNDLKKFEIITKKKIKVIKFQKNIFEISM